MIDRFKIRNSQFRLIATHPTRSWRG